jgi:hypothetical protein
VPPAPRAVWMGSIPSLEELRAKYAVDEVHYVDGMAAVLQSMDPPSIHVLDGVNTDRCGGLGGVGWGGGGRGGSEMMWRSAPRP